MTGSCYDWSQVLAHRFDPELEPTAQWAQAEAHLERCARCRRIAFTLDPTLAFRSAGKWTPEGGESAAIRQAVRTLRRAAELEARTGKTPGADETRARRDRGPLAAAVLFALVLAMKPASTARNGGEPVIVTPPAAAAQLLRVTRPAAPAIEGVDRPDARVYEWGADDLSVVMVVDESLDV